MKTLFTRDEILKNVGCYSKEDAVKILNNKPEFTINEILSLDIPLKDKSWFICKRCDFTDTEFRKFAIECAWVVLPIFEAKYPENKAPREAIEAAEQYLVGTISIDVLMQKWYAASDAAYFASSDAADAAADAAASYGAAAASYGSAYAGDAAAAADAAAANTKYRDLLLNFFKSFTQ